MKTKINMDWFYAAIIRAIKTMAQTALGMITVGAAINEIPWTYVISVSAVSGIYSILTSLTTGLPESGSIGTLQIDTTDPEKDTYLLNLGDNLEKVKTQKYVKIKIDANANLSQE